MLDITVILIVVMVSWVFAYVQTHQIEYIKYVQFLYINYTILKFYIGVSLINIIVLLSHVQQSDSDIHIQVSIIFQILFPFSLLQNNEQSSLCCTVGPCWLSIVYIAVCVCQSQTP